MTSDPRFHTPGRNGPGAGTEGPASPAVGQPPDGQQTPIADGERSGTQPGPGTQPPPEADEHRAEGEPAAEQPPLADGQTDELADELAGLRAQAARADEYLGLAQRTQADFENYRKRTARDAAAATQRGAMSLAKELLPAVDNLERALEHAPEASDDGEQAFVAGIEHVHSDLIAALQRAGIERYSPEGEQFDPTLHEAVAQQPFDGLAAGTVVEVFQRGYRIGDSVVRPARVVVAG